MCSNTRLSLDEIQKSNFCRQGLIILSSKLMTIQAFDFRAKLEVTSKLDHKQSLLFGVVRRASSLRADRLSFVPSLSSYGLNEGTKESLLHAGYRASEKKSTSRAHY